MAGLPRSLLCATLLLSLAACTSAGPFRSRPASPRDGYTEMLQRAGLDQTALGRDWTRAGEQALQTAVAAAPPFLETGYFPPSEAAAVAYRMDLRRGRRLTITVTYESAEPGRLFVDLFEASPGAPPRRLTSLAPDASTLTHDVERDATLLLRIQPELLRGGRFTVSERTLASLRFPVSGLTARAIQSVFGDRRDAGAREHEGVDIFASRGTATLAVTDGIAEPATNTLGGNVVWLHDRSGGHTFYYAHLERAAFTNTTRVRAGDIVGYIGNSGNARTTAPHLHFGVYDRGAIDPLPFLQPDDAVPSGPSSSEDRLDTLVRVTPLRATLRDGIDSAATARAELERGSIARVAGLSRSSLRVMLPDEAIGYVSAAAMTPAASPLRRERLQADTALRELPAPGAPVIAALTRDTPVEVLGTSGGYLLVRTGEPERQGWIEGS